MNDENFMWSDSTAPTLSLADYAKMHGISVAEAKARIEERERIKDGLALRAEKKAAAVRAKRGYLYNHEIDGAPLHAMSKRRYVQLHRASMPERGCKGGELLSEDCDFTDWLLKRPDMEHLRVRLEKVMNRLGWNPKLDSASTRLQNAAKHGRKERAGRLIFDSEKGAWA